MPTHPVHLTVEPALGKMLQMQRELQMRYNGGQDLDSFTDSERMDAIRINMLALMDELHEAMAETGWKPWATSNHLNRDSFHSELVDAFHFFMNLMLHSGMTAGDLVSGYMAKNAKNHKRQDDGYDGVSTKCPGCKRAYDDDAVKCYPAGAMFGGYEATKAGCELNRIAA